MILNFSPELSNYDHDAFKSSDLSLGTMSCMSFLLLVVAGRLMLGEVLILPPDGNSSDETT